MPAADARFTIGEVSAMSGIPVHTIRAWEQRHAVLTPQRTATGQRRYTLDDVDVLRSVRSHVDGHGMSLKLAVAAARGEPFDTPPALELPGETTESAGAPVAPWRGVVDLLPYVVCIVDPGGRLVDASVSWARTAGMLRRDVPGRRLVDFVQPYDRAKATRLYRPRLQSRHGWELNLRTRSGEGLFTFDAHVLSSGPAQMLALLGRPLDDAGVEHWSV